MYSDQSEYLGLGDEIEVFTFNELYNSNEKKDEPRDTVTYGYNLDIGKEIAVTKLDSIPIF